MLTSRVTMFSDLTQIMATSTDWNELVWAWQGWRNESGRRMPNMYEEFARLLNKAAVINGKYLVVLGKYRSLLTSTGCSWQVQVALGKYWSLLASTGRS